MVTSNAMNTNNTYVKYEISITQNSQSVNNNTSNVTVSVRFYRTNKGYKTWGSGTVYCKINGTTYTATVTPSQYITDSGIVLFSHTLNIPHNTDGSKTLTCSAWIEHNAPLTSSEQSFSVDLTTIPRKSSLSASGGTLGTEQTITVDRKSNNFTHTIMYQCGSTSGLICTKSTMTNLSFTPPLSLASENTTGTQVSVKLSIETFNGNTSIGTDSATISCTIPASVKPSCTIEVTDAAGCFDTYEAYVQSKSRFKINVTGTTAYGSKIVSYSTTVDGNTYSGSVVTTNAVKSAGRIKITTTVKDARGRTGSTSVELDVLAYNAPSISLLNVHRCDADGTENAQGEYVAASFTALVTALNSKNSAQYVLEYKKSTDSIYTAVALSDYAGNYNPINGTYLFEADTGSTYDVRLTASDDFETMVRNTSVSTGFAIMHWLASGLGMALGKIAEFADYLDVAWNARFRKNVEVDGQVSIDGNVMAGGHLQVGDNLDFYSDSEGGNIRLISPQGNGWEIDAFAERMRVYNDASYNPVIFTKDGDVQTSDGASLKRTMNMKFYSSPSELGCSQGIILENICGVLPEYSTVSFWISQDQYPSIYNQVLNGTGFSHAFGILTITRINSVWDLKWRAYDSMTEYTCRYTTINNTGWCGWTQSEGNRPNKAMWGGAWYMNETQTIALGEPISAQPHGIVLVWSEFTNGSAINQGFWYWFIPKYAVSAYGGCFHSESITHWAGTSVVKKGVFISDTTITGHSVSNSGDSGLMVLRYVLGV